MKDIMYLCPSWQALSIRTITHFLGHLIRHVELLIQFCHRRAGTNEAKPNQLWLSKKKTITYVEDHFTTILILVCLHC